MSLACKYGLLTNLYRVGNTSVNDYTVQDHTPLSVSSSKLIIKPTTIRWSEVKQSSMEIFKVVGSLCPFQSGDILSVDASENVTQPDITLYQIGYSYIGFKSDRIGAIYDGPTLIYNNIRFSILPSSNYPGKPLDREFKDTMDVASVEAITYKKVLYNTLHDAEGLYLHVKDRGVDIRYTIEDVTDLGNCQILSLKRDK